LSPRETPQPVSATYSLSSKLLIVTFDHQLERSACIDIANWSFVQNPTTKFTGTIPGDAAGRIVTVLLDSIVPVGLQSVGSEYDPPPCDIVGKNGLPAGSFTGFPTTLI
jgi:hypothetical protein